MRSFHRRAVPRGGRRCGAWRRPGVLAGGAALAVVASLALAACGGQATGSAQTAGGGSPGDVLTVGFALQAPQTLDPGKTAQNYEWLEQLAYEPLIVRHSDGSLAPGLATSWAYTGTGNTTFVLHLRPGQTTPPRRGSPRQPGRRVSARRRTAFRHGERPSDGTSA